MNNQKQFKLSSFLPFKLNVTADIVSQDFASVYSTKLKISRSQWRILALLHEKELLTAKQICEFTHMEKVMVSRAVKDLELRKLIKRKVNREDKRSLFLQLTAKGKKSIEQLIPSVNEWQAQVKKKIGAKNYNTLVKMLSDINESYEKPDL